MSEPTRSRLRLRPRHVIRWIAVVVVLLIAATAAYAWYNYSQFSSSVTHIDAIPAATTTSSTSSKGQNILLVGDDHRPAGASAQELALLGTTQDGGGTNTDTMMVLHIPANGAKASLISFPRDSWVSIPGFGMGKLNAAFAYGSEKGGDTGGAQLLVKTIENLSGLHIDHFVRISLIGFYDVANALPDIQVCLVNAVDDNYSTFKAPAGISTLNAQQALAFVRQRHGLPQGDLDREIRQRYFLTAEAKNFLSAGVMLDPGRLSAALKAMGSAVQTDPGLNMLSLTSQLKDLAGGNLTSTTIPIAGTPTIYYNGSAVSIVKVDTAALPAFFASLDKPATPAASSSVAPQAQAQAPAASVGGTTVTVLNGSGVSGAAATNTATLQSAGFRVTTPSTVSTRSSTTIQYPASMASQAALVARYVPGARLEAVTGVGAVTLVLGTDGDTAKSTPSAASGSSSSGSSTSGGGSGSGSSGTGSSGSAGSAGSAASTSAKASSIPCIN